LYYFLKRSVIIFLSLLLLTSCAGDGDGGNLKKAGLLIPDTINDQAWGTKGYKGMLKIQSHYNIDVYYKENMNSQTVVERAVKEFNQKGVNLIFGHGNEYVEFFRTISKKYPDIHFITFNGDATNKNVTSLSFEGYAMGFFAGMVAAYMTETGRVGIIPAHDWQPEVQGFYDGVQYQNKNVTVDTKFVGEFDDDDTALKHLDSIIENGSDIVYPAGDGYSVPVIERLKGKGLYAIGYISDQSDLGESTVLTSTVQNVDVLYEEIAKQFDKGELSSGNLSFDFQDDVISLGKFSPDIDQQFLAKLKEQIDHYKETGKLPN
jgi:transcriptional activator of comK gene